MPSLPPILTPPSPRAAVDYLKLYPDYNLLGLDNALPTCDCGGTCESCSGGAGSPAGQSCGNGCGGGGMAQAGPASGVPGIPTMPASDHRAFDYLNHAVAAGNPPTPAAGPSAKLINTLNPADGNLMRQIGLPSAGPLAPGPILTYNSANNVTDAGWGRGWNMNFDRRITEINSTTVESSRVLR